MCVCCVHVERIQCTPSFFAANCKTLCATPAENPLLVDADEETEAGPIETLQAAIVENLNLYADKYEEEFQPHLQSSTQLVWGLLMKVACDEGGNSFSLSLCACVCVFVCVCKCVCVLIVLLGRHTTKKTRHSVAANISDPIAAIVGRPTGEIRHSRDDVYQIPDVHQLKGISSVATGLIQSNEEANYYSIQYCCLFSGQCSSRREF